MKVNRHAKIVELVSKYKIETQEELAEKLKEEGFQITQATISRDIRDLQLTKVPAEGGGQKYVVLKATERVLRDKYIRILKDGFVTMSNAQNLVVIKTEVGMAMAVATAIDELKWSEVVGCIAGDDTIMCAVHDADEALIVMEKIRKIVL